MDCSLEVTKSEVNAIPYSDTETEGYKQQSHTSLGSLGLWTVSHNTSVHQTCSMKGNMMGGFSHRLQLTIPTARMAAARRC